GGFVVAGAVTEGRDGAVTAVASISRAGWLRLATRPPASTAAVPAEMATRVVLGRRPWARERPRSLCAPPCMMPSTLSDSETIAHPLSGHDLVTTGWNPG